MYSTKRTYRCPYSPQTEKEKIFREFSLGRYPTEIAGKFKVTMRTLFQYHYLWGKARELRDEVLAVIEGRSKGGQSRMMNGTEREIWQNLTANLLNYVERFPLTHFRPEKTPESLIPELVARWSRANDFSRTIFLSIADPRTGRRLIEEFVRCISE